MRGRMNEKRRRGVVSSIKTVSARYVDLMKKKTGYGVDDDDCSFLGVWIRGDISRRRCVGLLRLTWMIRF
jgi:hypothetical protein